MFHVRPLFLGLSAKEMLGLDGGHWDRRCVGRFGVMNVFEVSLIVPKRYTVIIKFRSVRQKTTAIKKMT